MKKSTAIALFITLTAFFTAPAIPRAGQSGSPETAREASPAQPLPRENNRGTAPAIPRAVREARSAQPPFSKNAPSPTGDETWGGFLGWESQREANTGKRLFRKYILASGDKTPGIPATPYAGQQTRAIKALSEKEIQGLLNGAGLGFAKAAELNQYPGPLHVLQLAGELGLTPARIARVKALYTRMKSEAVALGKQIVAREKHLDTLFATRRIDEASLRDATAGIGRLRGSLRAVHLSYHLKMKTLLTPHQTAAYSRLRGYGSGGGTMDHNKHGGQQR